jgi:hypothetical protein
MKIFLQVFRCFFAKNVVKCRYSPYDKEIYDDEKNDGKMMRLVIE